MTGLVRTRFADPFGQVNRTKLREALEQDRVRPRS